MAKQVKLKGGKVAEEVFVKGNGGGVSKYPWDEWFNGDLLMIERDELNEDGTTKHKKDYEVKTDDMPVKLKTAARKRYKVLTVLSRKDADGKKLADAIIIKARDMDAAERVAEDAKRAEEKQKEAERRAEEKAASAAS